MPVVEKLDYESDLVDALLNLSPNGRVNSLTWGGSFNTPDGSGGTISTPVGDALVVHPSGKPAILRLPTGPFDAMIQATLDVDKPATPEVETIVQEFHLAGTHSLATDPGGALGTIPKGGDFP